MGIRKTTEQFVSDAQRFHGDKYDYSNVEYINSTTRVLIVCPEHGEFWTDSCQTFEQGERMHNMWAHCEGDILI